MGGGPLPGSPEEWEGDPGTRRPASQVRRWRRAARGRGPLSAWALPPAWGADGVGKRPRRGDPGPPLLAAAWKGRPGPQRPAQPRPGRRALASACTPECLLQNPAAALQQDSPRTGPDRQPPGLTPRAPRAAPSSGEPRRRPRPGAGARGAAGSRLCGTALVPRLRSRDSGKGGAGVASRCLVGHGANR